MFFKAIFKKVLQFCLVFLSLFFITSGFWISKTFNKPSFEQILYHLQFGIDGLIDINSIFMKEFLLYCVLRSVILSFIFIYFDVLKSIFINLILQKPYTLLVISLFIFFYKIGLPNHIKKIVSNDDYFSKHYIDPRNVQIESSKQKKNLILIYAESLENTFSNVSIMGEDTLSAISIPEIGGVSFKNYKQVPGTNWTIAGIVSTQCGLPLKAVLGNIYDRNAFSEFTSFLPNAVCLGDILKKEGYKNIFVQGYNNTFSGIGNFFINHGYDNLYALEEIIASGDIKIKSMQSFGNGIHDQDVLEFAKITIDKHEKESTPYNITILTLDMHVPDGTPHIECGYKDKPQLSRAALCTSEKLANFVNYIKAKGYLKNTNLVIVGDHLFMGASFDKEKNRVIFNRFISEDTLIPNRDEIVHFDLFPSILYSMGFATKGCRLGLGYSGFGECLQPGENRIKEMQDKLLNYSKKYFNLWKNDKNKQEVK